MLINQAGTPVHTRVRATFLVAAAILCILALYLTHGERIALNFHEVQWEDRGFFIYGRIIIHSFADCFLQPERYPGLYRPLTTSLYYFLGARLFGDRIEVYHSINLVLLIINALLLYRLCALFLGDLWALIAAVLFVSRLATIEIVLHSCEFQGLLCAFFSFLAIDFFIRARISDRLWMHWCSIASFVLALLSRETAAVVPGILLLYGWLFDSRIFRLRYLWHPLVAILWAIAFRELLSRGQSPGFAYSYVPSNILHNYAGYFLDFSNFMVKPIEDMMPPHLNQTASGWAAESFIALLAIGELVAAAYLRKKNYEWLCIVVFGLGWFFIATLPFAIFQGRLFMRYSYFGHAGLALCVGALAREFARYAMRHKALTPTSA